MLTFVVACSASFDAALQTLADCSRDEDVLLRVSDPGCRLLHLHIAVSQLNGIIHPLP